ncbi:GMC family oxidoreductase [Pseudoalteromonas sp. MMG022]|uniref:GMC family oxidoreductase n=1 Tax=Pseudoalteromonas sp. MMG022 TaxID=2909978 RepID=UPI001F3F6D82|nr:GMC family oxidoreductase [Pseudoalteromonas sp. MMG022]MCF6437652.1 GMC family oxidoreductase [Pseudoalteromonas sp. MMG022]
MYDVVIVGSGVAGSICANELVKKGLKVAVLDAGHTLQRADLVLNQLRSGRDDSMSPYPLLPHAPHPDPVLLKDYPSSQKRQYDTSYIRTVGGTTWHWGGASWRFLPSDFKLKSNFGVGRDWGIDYQDLEPYYVLAEREMGISGEEIKQLKQWRSAPYPLPPVPLSYMDSFIKDKIASANLNLQAEPAARNTKPYDKRPSCCGSNNCIPICPIGAQYSAMHTLEKAIKSGVELIENAVVHRLEDNQKGEITNVIYTTPDGKDVSVKGKYFILAANAIESAKILLLSKTVHSPKGIANSSGLVGKNLMDHPTVHATFDIEEPVYSGRGPVGISAITDFMDGDFRKDYAAKKLAIGNGNFSEIIATEMIGDLLLNKDFKAQLKHKTIRRIGSHTQHEQLPSIDNKVTLSTTKFDALGLPYPEVTWDVEEYVIKSAEHSVKVYQQLGKLLGATDTKINVNLASNAHMLGTTIMGDDPKTSVVNADCFSHDHSNLTVAGGAVFPSSSSVNPTLTVAALSIRLSEKLSSLIKEK